MKKYERTVKKIDDSNTLVDELLLHSDQKLVEHIHWGDNIYLVFEKEVEPQEWKDRGKFLRG